MSVASEQAKPNLSLPERARRFTAALRREFSPAAADAPFTLAELG